MTKPKPTLDSSARDEANVLIKNLHSQISELKSALQDWRQRGRVSARLRKRLSKLDARVLQSAGEEGGHKGYFGVTDEIEALRAEREQLILELPTEVMFR